MLALLLPFLSLLALFTTHASATALTYKLVPNEKECFYTHIEKPGVKIAFYFAVQTGGSFDINYAVYGPAKEAGKERVVLDGEKERQGDFVFTANEAGEYRFCFDNNMSTVSDKLVDFEIAVENEARSSLPQKAGATPEQLSGVEETILKLSGQVSTLVRQQKYFRTRENRNFSTVRSTEGRIFRFSLLESGLMVAMAALQVFIVKMFFTGGRKGEIILFHSFLGCWTVLTTSQVTYKLSSCSGLVYYLYTIYAINSGPRSVPSGLAGWHSVVYIY
ncbi:hypothetical protein D0863_07214 [Hortaea werneckii]|uniref:GOLD domain-containing protein n=1 Tax=Hortaea werneckii TaxID=91943 RepID=A0A3M7DVD6_HORWE|nr:hypothetical protein D0863_07214 [Hortaea werneckii]